MTEKKCPSPPGPHKLGEEKNNKPQDFPDGPVDKNWPPSAADMDSSLVFKIPHAAEQLRLCTTATEPKVESPCITVTTEACAPRACAPQQANHQLEAQGQQ